MYLTPLQSLSVTLPTRAGWLNNFSVIKLEPDQHNCCVNDYQIWYTEIKQYCQLSGRDNGCYSSEHEGRETHCQHDD